ncbi:MAG: hypothetical protein MUP53_05500, partial [Bacteroidales bacterium]|nr:hypothetical protein [Bacteroidales bacterium]
MKLKHYLILAAGVLILALTVWGNYNRKQYLKAKAENIRYEYNQRQLLDEVNQYKRLDITQKEMLASITVEQDSLIRLLKIKPKQIERIVERTHIEIDTTERTQLLASNDSLQRIVREKLDREYPFIDHEGCFTFAGNVSIKDG